MNKVLYPPQFKSESKLIEPFKQPKSESITPDFQDGRWVSVAEYAREQGISKKAAYKRIEKNNFVAKKSINEHNQEIVCIFIPAANNQETLNQTLNQEEEFDILKFVKEIISNTNKINILNDEEAKELESKEAGMWATVDEYVKVTGLKKWTIYRKIKNNELIAKKASNIYNKFHKETLYIWVRNKKIISIIEIDKKIKNQELSIKIEISSNEAEKIQEEIKEIQPKKGEIKKDKRNNLIIQGKIQIEDLLPLIKKTV